MAGEPEVKFGVAYRCLGCNAALEDRNDRRSLWLRCPICGQAGRPPVAERGVGRSAAAPRDDLYFLDDPPEVVVGAKASGGTPWTYAPAAPARRPGSAWRFVFAAALFVSVILLGFALVEGNSGNVSIFAGASVVLLGLFLRSLGT